MGAFLQLERMRHSANVEEDDSPSLCIAVFDQERFLYNTIIDFQQYHLDLLCVCFLYNFIFNCA